MRIDQQKVQEIKSASLVPLPHLKNLTPLCLSWDSILGRHGVTNNNLLWNTILL